MGTGFLIVEDDTTFAQSLARRIGTFAPSQVVHTLADARAAIAENGRFDGLVLDLVLPDGLGLDLLREVRAEGRDVPVLVLTGELDRALVNTTQLLRAEYVCKPATDENLRPFLKAALARARVEDGLVAERIQRLAAKAGLTERECDVLAKATGGPSRRQLARVLGVSENTVKAQIRSILRKTGARSLATLIQQLLRGED
jgi:DNA-binding NarL/FixJ family response regulator